TGEVYPANVAIKGERVAYVGRRDDMVGRRTRVIDASGRVLCPGYIDPHVHPAHLITPSAMARHIVPLGTTTVFADTLQFWALGGGPGMLKRLALARGPGRRAEGHTAGAKAERMAAIAAAGFTSDHEPITAAQVLERARQGISVMLRESSLRPDLVGLLDALK